MALRRRRWRAAGSGGAAAALRAAARMSSLVMVPSGPVPRTRLISTPSSLARRRALGEIWTRRAELAQPLRRERRAELRPRAAGLFGHRARGRSGGCVFGGTASRRARESMRSSRRPERRRLPATSRRRARRPPSPRFRRRLCRFRLREGSRPWDGVAFLLQPRHNLSGLLRHFERRHHNAGCHMFVECQCCGRDILCRRARRAASNTVLSVGTVASSSGGEKGIGTCIAPILFTGASRSKNAPSAIDDAISAVTP